MISSASMNFREWTLNRDLVNEFIPSHDRANDGVQYVLGISWNSKKDKISLKPKQETMIGNPTKRSILKAVASCFGPLGLFSPVILHGELLILCL